MIALNLLTKAFISPVHFSKDISEESLAYTPFRRVMSIDILHRENV